VSLHKVCDGLVPRCPIGADVGHIPPVAVELPVCEVDDLCKTVEEALKQSKEAGKPAYQADSRQFQYTLQHVNQVEPGDIAEAVL